MRMPDHREQPLELPVDLRNDPLRRSRVRLEQQPGPLVEGLGQGDDRNAIRAALAGIELKDSILPGGVLKFTKTGQAVLPFVVTQNKPDGKVDLVWPKEARTGDPVAPLPKKD